MQRSDETYTLDKEYNGFVLCTDGKVFFTKDERGEVLFEAKTLEALKTKCRKPKELNIAAVILENEYHYYGDPDEPKPKKVTVYGVSPTGAFLYVDEKGNKDKTSRHGSHLRALRTTDGSDVQQYIDLKKASNAARQALEDYVDAWPRMNAKSYLNPDGAE